METVKASQSKIKRILYSTKEVECQINYQNLFMLFIIGSIAGFLLEGVCHIFKAGSWENHSAVVWGPFCIIYGIGAIAVYLISCCSSGRSLFWQFAAFTFSGAAIEYLSSLFQEICFGSVSWDYSDHFMNIGGRVSLQMALFWGVLGLLFIKFVFPLINCVLYRIQGKFLTTVCTILSIFMAINLIITVAALFRWQQRQNDIQAPPLIEATLDNYFNDDIMAELYPNMRFQS